MRSCVARIKRKYVRVVSNSVVRSLLIPLNGNEYDVGMSAF